MKYMLFTCRDPNLELDPEQRTTIPAAVAAWCEEMEARAESLWPPSIGSEALLPPPAGET